LPQAGERVEESAFPAVRISGDGDSAKAWRGEFLGGCLWDGYRGWEREGRRGCDWEGRCGCEREGRCGCEREGRCGWEREGRCGCERGLLYGFGGGGGLLHFEKIDVQRRFLCLRFFFGCFLRSSRSPDPFCRVRTWRQHDFNPLWKRPFLPHCSRIKVLQRLD